MKLLAVMERTDGNDDENDDGGGDRSRVSVRVHPAMLRRTHPLAAVRGAFNAVFVEGDARAS